MIAVQPVKYGYLSDVACSTTQVLVLYVRTMPAGVKICHTFASILRLIGCRWRFELFKKYSKDIRIYI